MAKNGSFEFTASGYLQGKIDWSSSSNGSTANSSNITAILYARRTNSATTTGRSWSGYVKIQGKDNSNQVNINFSSSVSVSSNWVEMARVTLNNAKHNNDGNGYATISGSVTGPSGTQLAGNTSSGSSNVSLDTIPRYATMTSATNFNDEQNPSFTYSNPAGLNNLRCWLEINPTGEHLAERNITSTATSGTYTWELTEEERNKLRAKIPNNSSATCRIGLYSTLGGSTQASFKDMTFSIVNGNPIFSNFTFEDINSTTLALTGDSSKNVNGFSTIKATISVANKAEAIKSASMSKYRFIIGTTSTDITYSDDESVSGNISNATNGTYNIYAIDSRNNSTLVTKLASEEIAYTPINFVSSSCKVERNNGGVGKFAILTINGDIWNNNFGQVSNDITSVLVEYKETSSSIWLTSPTTITPTISGNSFNFSGQVASQEQDYSFELNKSYDFRITIEDELSTKTIQLTPMASAVPNISLADEGVGIMCDYDESLGGDLQVGGEKYIPYPSDWFKFRRKSVSVNVPGGGSNFDVMSSLEEPTGYTFFTVIPYRNGYSDQWVVSYSRYGNRIVATIYSKWNGNLSNSLEFSVIYIRSDLIDSFIVN